MLSVLPWLLWIIIGALIISLWAFAWLEVGQFRHFLEGIQAWWGPGASMVDQVDGWLHGLVGAIATLWLAWPLTRRGRPWWPAPTVIGCIALTDELVQGLTNAGRSASLHDLAWGTIGIAVAVGILLTRRPATRRDARMPPARRRR